MKILKPTAEAIELACEEIQAGKLIGLPTETVYGIGASALNPEAIRRIYELKGRPSDNPLIVHVASLESVFEVAEPLGGDVLRLAEIFWPGPLTLVLRKNPAVPEEVTAGLDTVAVRVPSHSVARTFLEACEVPIAAPSANRFMALSPTRAEDIAREIADGLALILDGGPCPIGVESTVLDCSTEPFVLLRPGAIRRQQIEAVVGILATKRDQVRRSPGQYRRHYAPRTPLRIVPQLSPGEVGLTFSAPHGEYQVQMPKDPDAYAAVLYAELHRLDGGGFASISVEAPPQEDEWEAVWDRILKASQS